MTPRWKAVAVELGERIARGDHGADGSLPTESALCTEFGVSRITVRHALDSLRADGLVTASRGRGWRVTGVQSGAPIGLFRVTNHEGPDAVPLSIDTLSFETRPASETDPGTGQRVLRAIRLVRSGETPIDLIEILIGEPFASAITLADINGCPPARLLARKGCALGRTDQWATARAATTEDVPLGVEPGAPLLVVERTVFGSESPILRTTHRHPGHLVRLDEPFPSRALTTRHRYGSFETQERKPRGATHRLGRRFGARRRTRPSRHLHGRSWGASGRRLGTTFLGGHVPRCTPAPM